MRPFMHQGLLQEAVLAVLFGLFHVNQDVVVPSAEEFSTPVDPDRLDSGSQRRRKPADRFSILLGFCQCRYMNDFAVFAPTKSRLRAVLAALRRFLHERLRLQLREERTLLAPVTQGVPVLGLRVFPGLVRLDGRKLARLRRRIRDREAGYTLGRIDEDGLARSVRGMVGHVCHADTHRVRERLFAASLELG